MKIMRIADIPEVPRSGGIFTNTVYTKALVGPEMGAKDLTVSIVSFPKGVRNTFHTHTYDQCLWVLSGKGIIADEKEEVVVTEGMVAFIPASERHWHGATKDSAFSHISIVRTGQTKG
jgi:quercetin dioxygenase-like cupin family protein